MFTMAMVKANRGLFWSGEVGKGWLCEVTAFENSSACGDGTLLRLTEPRSGLRTSSRLGKAPAATRPSQLSFHRDGFTTKHLRRKTLGKFLGVIDCDSVRCNAILSRIE